MNINKLGRSILLTALAASAVVLGACTNPTEVKTPASPSPSPAISTAPSGSPAASPSGSPAVIGERGKPDALLGKWQGVEGASLNVAKKGEKYSIEIANPDGSKTFEGTAKGEAIEFTRNGKTETIKTAAGSETGMKGFEKEPNCVVIAKGEGFCRK